MANGGAIPTGTDGNPILGAGFTGKSGWIWMLCLLGLAGLLGLAFTLVDPIKIGALLVFLIFVVLLMWVALQFPVTMLCVIVAAQVLIPVYVRLPVPGLPSVPPPLLLMVGFIGITLLKQILNPTPLRTGRYERFVATAVLIYGGALAITLPSEHANSASYMMFIKTYVVPAFLFFILMAIIRTRSQLERIYQTLLVAAVICAILAMHEYSVGKNVLAATLAPPVTIDEDFFLWLLANADEAGPYLTGVLYRVFSTFTQPLEYSAFMVMSLPYPALKFVTETRPLPKALYGIAGVLVLIGFVVSFSRGPTLALGLVFLFLAVYERRVRPWILFVIIAMLIALAAAWPFIGEAMSERISGKSNITLRFSLWQNGIATFLENPIKGIGYGSYPNYHVESIRAHQIGPMYEYSWPHIERVTTVENIYVTLMAETGVLGLGAFLTMLGVYFYVFRKVVKLPSEQTRILALSSCGAVLAYLLSGMTVANIIGYTVSILFFGVHIAGIGVLSRALPDTPMRKAG
ncbi:O-antigen ligase family protein [Aquicoccus sp. G2-2]|uniref:O-antigen ligase family protein n=1 Tax=Aquicoccus sp. G2-2 TaxID=3092120 RepID=UPI002AE07590|nr:O-antigen ligase family protein [Aquicoccus sp. G2-2]MEA1114602.1 O-antigen ligase family protein [Aquicoccus sp. G2-2]